VCELGLDSGCWQPATGNWEPHRRILVIRPGALGDVLLTLPALQALQEAFPQAEIEVMGNLAVLRWLPGRSVVAAVSSFDRVDLAGLFQSSGVVADCVQGYLAQFDWILSYAVPPERLFARNLSRLARSKVLSFDARPRPELRMHMSLQLQQPLRELGVSVCTEPPCLRLTAADQQGTAQWWLDHGLGDEPVLAVHPGSGSPAKNWPAERFAAVARNVQRERGAGILLISGPADERAVVNVQRALDGVEYVLLHDPPLPLLAAILARCWAYLGNDSGVSHLAAAVGVPTVAIFGPTDPDVWAPRGASVHVVRASASCAPCSAEERNACQQRMCLEAVSADEVFGLLQGMALTPGLCPLATGQTFGNPGRG